MIIILLMGMLCITIILSISDYIRACAEAKRNQARCFKVIEEYFKRQLQEQERGGRR